MAYLRKGVVSWKLSCKLLSHFTNLWLTDSFWALPKILHHWPLPWRPLVRPVVPWSGHFGYFVSRHANCQWTVPKKKRSWVPTDLNSCAFSIGIILTSKAKWDFCVNSYSLVSRRIIIFASVRTCLAVTMRRQRDRHYFKWIQSKFREKEKFSLSSLAYVLKKNFSTGNFLS